MALQKQVWLAGIKENPMPNTSFINASTDLSEHVENNKINLSEAGIEPDVYEDYFAGNENELPTTSIVDIPSEVVLKTYSTSQTRHRDLQEVELNYNKRESVINRHKKSLAKNLGKRASFAWAPSTDNAFNKIINTAANASIIDAIIDMAAFYQDLDMTENLNICLSADHMKRIQKENKVLYKEIMKGEDLYGFKVYRYSQNPYYTSAGAKLPFGALPTGTDKKCSFTWCSDEVFRCYGNVEMYATLKHSGLQADVVSFAQRALAGNIRASNQKYAGAIL